MALDYYVEIKQYGTEEKKMRLCKWMLSEFPLNYHKDSGIMTGIGLGVSVFVDYDSFEEAEDSKTIPNLIVSFRVEKKGEQRENGYKLLLRIVLKILEFSIADLRLTEGSDECVLLQRDSGAISKFFPEHDLWKMSALAVA